LDGCLDIVVKELAHPRDSTPIPDQQSIPAMASGAPDHLVLFLPIEEIVFVKALRKPINEHRLEQERTRGKSRKRRIIGL
jgi:hypothetical protein